MRRARALAFGGLRLQTYLDTRLMALISTTLDYKLQRGLLNLHTCKLIRILFWYIKNYCQYAKSSRNTIRSPENSVMAYPTFVTNLFAVLSSVDHKISHFEWVSMVTGF